MPSTNTLHSRVKRTIITACKENDTRFLDFILLLMRKPGQPWSEKTGEPTPEGGHRGYRAWQEIIIVADQTLEGESES